jgi:hypothetical protein
MAQMHRRAKQNSCHPQKGCSLVAAGKRQAFFSEEKNQKTISGAVADLAGGTRI